MYVTWVICVVNDLQTLRSKPLPNLLSSPPENAPTNSDMFSSTTGLVHSKMPLVRELQHPLHKKAPSLLKVNYTLDTIQKVRQKACPWKINLTRKIICVYFILVSSLM